MIRTLETACNNNISHPCRCYISLFSSLIKPFYTDVFYLPSLWSYLHKLWS